MTNNVGVTSPSSALGALLASQVIFPLEKLTFLHTVLLPKQNESNSSYCLIYSNISSENIWKDAHGTLINTALAILLALSDNENQRHISLHPSTLTVILTLSSLEC